mgnify:CR=1 FL=1
MRENPITVAKCPQCQGILFVQTQIHILKKDDNQRLASVLDIPAWKCLDCGGILDESVIRSTYTSNPGQQATIKKEIKARIPEALLLKPQTATIDLNEFTGIKKKLLAHQGGLSGMGGGLPSSGN